MADASRIYLTVPILTKNYHFNEFLFDEFNFSKRQKLSENEVNRLLCSIFPTLHLFSNESLAPIDFVTFIFLVSFVFNRVVGAENWTNASNAIVSKAKSHQMSAYTVFLYYLLATSQG